MTLDTAQIMDKLSKLKTRFDPEHNIMKRLDPWRYLLHDEIEEELWGNIESDKRGETIAKPEINAVTDTLVAITSTKEPSIQIRQRNALNDQSQMQANLNERIGYGIFHEVDKYRDESLLKEGPEWMFHRGKAILKLLWLSPEERGEVRDDTLTGFDDQTPLTDDNQEVTQQGTFPIYMTLLDPLECFYTLNPLTREVTMMIHEYYDTWDSITAMFPDIKDSKDFEEEKHTSLNSPVKVIDYWDEEVNAIIIRGKFYKKPTPHQYPWVPFVVQSGRTRRRKQINNLPFMEAVPFCDPMYKSVRDLSWSLSVLATYMKRLGFSTLVHYGLPSDGSSPWFSAQRDSDGVMSDIDYRLTIDISPNGDIVPLYHNPATGVQERLEYLRPPDMVAHWQAFAAERNADVEVVSFGRAFLSGVMQADLSGYSVSLQRQLSMARIEPYVLALNRLFSRTMMMVFELIATELRREGRAGVPLVIQGLIDEPEQQITAELAEYVRVVDFQFRPDLPSDREADEGLIMQQVQAGVLSPVKAIDLIGRVQDANDEFEDIIAQQDMMTNPVARLALLRKKMIENGYIDEGDQYDQQLAAQAQALQNQRQQQQEMDQMMTMMAAAGQAAPEGEAVPVEGAPTPNGNVPV